MANQANNDTGLLEKTRDKVTEPPRYSCVIYNDHFTTRDFVVYVLVKIFQLQEQDALKKMMDVHRSGKGKVGNYSYDIAATKANEVVKLAQDNDYPLKCTVEPL
ncbi:MAG: ATP-dependent Clp protease adaptor ClpS [Spirochaetales bacterium]